MKVLAINGSPHEDGNTVALINMVFDELEREGIDTELLQLGGKLVRGCRVCLECVENQDNRCSIVEDPINEMIAKMMEADGIILGSPTYFSNVTTEMKALIDRAGFVSRSNRGLFKRKVGAAVVAVRRAGGLQVFNAINQFFIIGQMIIPGSSYWNLGMGLKPGDVASDEEGVRTMKDLGVNMAWLLKKLQ